MILTYKVKHFRDFSDELKKAKKVANFGIVNRDRLSSKFVKHMGLKSTIASQILWKYGRNRKCKTISSVNLIVPGQGVKRNKDELSISCLKLKLTLEKPFLKVNQVELDDKYALVSVTVPDAKEFKEEVTIGVDRNTTGHVAVAAILETGKVFKFGKSALHTHLKYKHIRKSMQSRGKFRKLVTVKRRESNITRNLNHEMSRSIVDLAVKEKGRIVLEDLGGIRGRAKTSRSFRFALHSWSFFQLQTFLEYKAKLAGVPISFVDPYHTSKCCSRCGLVGNRNGKRFKCENCSHVEHADTNAAFNIANVAKGVFDFRQKDLSEKGTLISRKGLCLEQVTLEPHRL